jgi:hypothetical protein
MNKENHDQDLGAVFSDSRVSLDEEDRLSFAKQILIWIGVICIGIFCAFGIYPENKALALMFEFIKVGALPLITLIISFYFPSSK